MAFAASLKVILGLALARTDTTGSATVLIAFLPSNNSALSCILNSFRGRSCRPAATRISGSTLGSTFAGSPSARVSKASTALFSCSIFLASLFRGFRERLGIGTLHARPQAAQRAELQLFHRAFGFANLPHHFLNPFLLHEPQHHDPPLFPAQPIDQPKPNFPPLYFFKFHGPGGGRLDLLAPD